MWLDIDRTWTSLCKQICKQPDFLANGADLIERRETWLTKIMVDILFGLMSTLENCLISTYLLWFSTRVQMKIIFGDSTSACLTSHALT